MKIIYFQELKEYPETTLLKLLENDFYEIKLFLKSQDIIREIKKNKKLEKYFVFDYIGLIGIKNKIIAVLPKYIKSFSEEQNNTSNLNLILKVINKYNKSLYYQEFEALDYEDTNNKTLNRLALLNFLFNDYIEHGLYTTIVDNYEMNSSQFIDWNKTICQETPYISNAQVIYLDFWTKTQEKDEFNYIRQLHKFVLQSCLNEVFHLQTLNILNIPSFSFHINKDILGNKEYQINMIDNELSIQFSEHKIRVLKALKMYILNSFYKNNKKISLWGTKNFDRIWEIACKNVLGDMYKKESIYYKHMKEKTITSWLDTLILGTPMKPDIVYEFQNTFYLLDAKYYNLYDYNFSMNVQDISKQFLYLKVFLDLKLNNGKYVSQNKIINAFIFPGEVSEEIKGKYFSRIKMPLFEGQIHSIILDANNLFYHYLLDKKYLNMYIKKIIPINKRILSIKKTNSILNKSKLF